MRHVVSSQEVYHLWAHQTQDEARNSCGSVSFRCRDAYSYRAVIGRIAVNEAGEQLYLVSTRHYSTTTNGHQSALRRAIPKDWTVLYVPAIGPPRNMIDNLVSEYEASAHLASRARSQKQGHIHDMQRAIDTANRLAAFYGVPKPDFPDYDLDNLRKELAEADKIRRERERAAEAKALEDAKEKIADWMAGKSVHIPYTVNTHFLRVVGDQVQTSNGAIVPLAHVMRAAPLILRLIGKAIREHTEIRPEHDIRLGYYHLNSIGRDGTVTVGCHRFTADEVRRFAQVIRADDMATTVEAATAA